MRPISRPLVAWAVLALVLALLAPSAVPAGPGEPAPPRAGAGAQSTPAPADTRAPDRGGDTPDAEGGGESPGGTDREFDRLGHGGDKLAVMSDVDIAKGQEVSGSVVCIGGKATIDGTVHGDVVVIAGKLEMSGSAEGTVVGIATKAVLREGARVGGDLVNVGGALDRRSDVSVGGQTVNVGLGRWAAHFPGSLGTIGLFLIWAAFIKLVVVFVALLLLAVFVPGRIQVLSADVPLHPFMAFLAGLGGYIALVVVMVLLCVTLIGIPAAMLLYFVFVVVKWLGLAGIFHFVGQRIGRMMGREMSLLGAILLGFLPFALLRFLPLCIGSFLWLVLEVLAVGYVVLTRAGGRPYTPPRPAPAVPSPPPAAAPAP